MLDPNVTTSIDDDGFSITIRGEYGAVSVTGWPQVREELALQDDECSIPGVTVVEQVANYHDDEDFPFGFGPIELSFDGIDAYTEFIETLQSLRSDRRDGGDYDGAEEIGGLCNRLPSRLDIQRGLDD